ncbi:hypothetical protein Mal35_21040 [Gimesia maris]|nr:hypothetical protein Mal35_21040 [Gimesia maris]
MFEPNIPETEFPQQEADLFPKRETSATTSTNLVKLNGVQIHSRNQKQLTTLIRTKRASPEIDKIIDGSIVTATIVSTGTSPDVRYVELTPG